MSSPRRRRPAVLVVALALAVCVVAPSSALATHCPTNWKRLSSTRLVDAGKGIGFGHLTVYRQRGKRSVCAQVSLASGFSIDTLQFVQRKHVLAQRNGNLFLFDTLPGTRKRFTVGVVARKHGGVFSDSVHPTL